MLSYAMAKTFFISDTHFGHDNIIKLCDRPFENVTEMNETMIANWNKKVTNADIVYIMGDLFFRTQTPPEEILKRLKGKKHLIRGNHDKSWYHAKYDKFFESVTWAEVINTTHGITMLSHFPMCDYEGKYLIHGHIHAHKNDSYWPYLQARDRILNASVEINDYSPVTFEELIENNIKFKNSDTIET
jgi:calcineurin-like phosphoesterase family protein